MTITYIIDRFLLIIFAILFGIVIFADSQVCKNEAKGLWGWGVALFVMTILAIVQPKNKD